MLAQLTHRLASHNLAQQIATGSRARSIAALVLGVSLGALATLYESRGVHISPVGGWAVVVLGSLLGLLPIVATFAAMIVLGSFHGLLISFVSGHASYWKEALLLVLVGRALARGRPSRIEYLAALAMLAFFGFYLVAGFGATQVAWGSKLLLEFALFGWAAYRLTAPGPRIWLTVVHALGVAQASGCVLALWQRHEGWQGLVALGLPYGESVRESGGHLRAFAGFVYEAPFAYVAALTILAWWALALRREREARTLAWVPLLAAVNIYLSLNRTALMACCAAALCMAVQLVGRRMAVAALCAILAAAVSFIGFRHVRQAAYRDSSLQARVAEWPYYLHRISATGQGPATAGAAYEHIVGRRYSVYVIPARAARTTDARVAKANRYFHVTDNIYIGWLFQYGYVFGGVVIAVWLGILFAPFAIRPPEPDAVWLSAGGFGVFFALAGMFNSVWEEFPPNLILALSFAIWLAQWRSSKAALVQRNRWANSNAPISMHRVRRQSPEAS